MDASINYTQRGFHRKKSFSWGRNIWETSDGGRCPTRHIIGHFGVAVCPAHNDQKNIGATAEI